jgi:hypothetical protein
MKHLLTLTLAFCASACQKDEPREVAPAAPAVPTPEPPAPHAVPPLAPPPGHEAKRDALMWTDPPAWTREPSPSSMRVATYRIPRAARDGEDAELAVFYFGPGGAGGVDANVDRWTKQFEGLEPGAIQRSERVVHGLTQHLVEVERGTYASGMPGGPKTPREGYGMIAAIVTSPAGPYFFKLTGPAATVGAARQTFMELLDGVRPSS